MVAEEAVESALKKLVEDCLITVNSILYPRNEAICCEMHNANWSENATSHNCLGCNFADSVDRIRHGLMFFRSGISVDEVVSAHIINMYLFAERAEFIYKIATDKSLGDNGFTACGEIKRWANFIKHPKAFMFAHHPEFDFEGSGLDLGCFDLEIDQSCIDRYYANGKRNSELLEKIQNVESLIVVYPNMRTLTEKFCNEVVRVTREIQKDNFMDKLRHQTTREKYFDDV
jgi:hypothetical protein